MCIFRFLYDFEYEAPKIIIRSDQLSAHIKVSEYEKMEASGFKFLFINRKPKANYAPKNRALIMRGLISCDD